MENNITFDNSNHEFCIIDEKKAINYNSIEMPLSMIVQVTRKCNLKCSFCSESDNFEDPTIYDLETLCNKIKGVKRIYLSGGEPLIRKDIFEIIDMYKKSFDILGLPSNCIEIDKKICEKLRDKVSYINAGLDGPRNVNNSIRGDYDKIINGLYNLKNSGIEVSLSTVILKKTLPYLEYVIQIADMLDVVKVKMVVPVLRGRAKQLNKEDFADNQEIINKFEKIKLIKYSLGWKPRIKFAFWDKSTEGYALMVFPNQKVFAWPIFNAEDCVEYIGNLKEESLQSIWQKYPYKINHINKYIGKSMNKA